MKNIKISNKSINSNTSNSLNDSNKPNNPINSNKSNHSIAKIEYKLRKFEKTDIDSISKYANNPNIAKSLTNEFPYPYSKVDAESFINIVSKETPTEVFAIEINKEAVGAVSISPQNAKNNYNYNKNTNKENTRNKENITEKETTTKDNRIQNTPINICSKPAELGYWLAEKYWNNGIMTSAIRKMINYGFETFDIDCIFATPFKSNMASQKVLKKVGFETDSKLRRIIKNKETYEVFIFSLSKN